MYITVQEVRDRVKLLTSGIISDADIKKFIIDAESYINMCLAKLYLTPIVPLTKPEGTITVTGASKVITGTNTLFNTNYDLLYSNHIYIIDSREVAVIDTVTSNTVAASVVNFANSATASQYYVIPEEICTATRYYAGKLVLEWKFAEQAFNQSTENVSSKYDDFAMKILKQLEGNKYYNASLTPQISTQNPARAIGVYQGNITTNFDNNQAIIDNYSTWWTL